MQNAMDIMAMVQKTNMVKQKSDVPSKTLGYDKASFRNELNQASKFSSHNNIPSSKDANANPQRTTENSIEKFAKAMSSNNIKASIKEKPSVDASEQTDATTNYSLIPAEIVQDNELQENTTLEEPTQSVIEMLQQIMQMMEGLKAEGVDNQEVTDLETALQTIVQKLEQALAIPAANQSSEATKLLNSLKSDLTELVKQLEVVNEYKLDPKQTEQIINQFTEKLNQAKTQLHQVLQQVERPKENADIAQKLTTIAVKIESKETNKQDNTVQDVKSTVDNQQIEAINTDKASDSKSNKNGSEKSNEKDDESPYDLKANTETKQTLVGDKLNQNTPKDLAIPQKDTLDFQLNIKQANANLQKDSLVKINKTDILNQVIKKADIFIQGSHQEMIMKLEPESLGKLNLKLVVENGLITAKFVAESQQVKEVLESNFNKLKDTLQEKGIAVQSFSVSVGQEGAQFNSGQGFEQWKKTIKFNSKASGGYMDLDEETSFSVNPYNYHEGKVDYRA
jgi:flagellar hook-length control protein FliK